MSHEVESIVVGWDDVHQLPGRSFRGPLFRIDQVHADLFDRASYVDENDTPMDPGIYAEGLVEGFHLLSMLDHLTNAVLVVDDPHWSGWNYGFDRVRFVSEVTTFDSIFVSGTIASVEDKGDRRLVTLDCAIEVAGREKPGMVATWKILWTREPS